MVPFFGFIGQGKNDGDWDCDWEQEFDTLHLVLRWCMVYLVGAAILQSA